MPSEQIIVATHVQGYIWSVELNVLALIKSSANLRRSEEGSGGGLISHGPPVAIPAVKETLEQSCDKVVTVQNCYDLAEMVTIYKHVWFVES